MSKQAEYPPYDDRAIPVSDHSGKSKYGDVTLNSTCQNIALCNIDISLRRIADSIDIRKELDERTCECKKLTDELARMRVNCDMYADARDKAIAEKEALERRITKELSGGVVQVQSDLAAANQCIEELHAKMTTFDIPDRQRLIELETIIRKYREEKDKEESWRRSR